MKTAFLRVRDSMDFPCVSFSSAMYMAFSIYSMQWHKSAIKTESTIASANCTARNTMGSETGVFVLAADKSTTALPR